MNIKDFLHQKRNETNLQDRQDYLHQLKKMHSFLEVAKENELKQAENEVKSKFNPLLEYLKDQIIEREACIHLKKKYDITLNEIKPNSSEAFSTEMDS